LPAKGVISEAAFAGTARSYKRASSPRMRAADPRACRCAPCSNGMSAGAVATRLEIAAADPAGTRPDSHARAIRLLHRYAMVR